MKNSFLLLAILTLLVTSCERSIKPTVTFMLQAKSGELTQNALRLDQTEPHVWAMTMPPIRETWIHKLQDFVKAWPTLFGKSAPNAALSFVVQPEHAEQVILEVYEPKLEGDSLTFQIHYLEEMRPTRFEKAVLFIDLATDTVSYENMINNWGSR